MGVGRRRVGGRGEQQLAGPRPRPPAGGGMGSFRIVQTNAALASTQDITSAGWGKTPTAVWLWLIREDTLAVAGGGCFNLGAADGNLDDRNVSIVSEDTASPSVCQTRGGGNRIVQVMDDAGNTIAAASVDSFISNGVRLTWNNQPEDDYLLVAVMAEGTSPDFVADLTEGTLPPNLTSEGTVTFSAAMDVVLFFAKDGTAFDATARNHARIQAGVWSRDADAQGVVAFTERNGRTTTQCRSLARDDRFYVDLDPTGTSFVSGEVVGTDGNNLTIRTRDVAPTVTHTFVALGLKVGAAPSWAGFFRHPSSTGTEDFTPLSFAPELLLTINTLSNALGTLQTGPLSAGFGLGAMDASSEYSASYTSEDGKTGGANVQTELRAVAHHLPKEDGTDGDVATLDSFLSNGWRFDYSSVRTTTADAGSYSLGIAIGSPELLITPAPVVISLSAPAPDLFRLITPGPVAISTSAPAPDIVRLITPGPVAISTSTPAPDIVRLITPDPVVVTLLVPDPTLDLGGIVITPDPVVLTLFARPGILRGLGREVLEIELRICRVVAAPVVVCRRLEAPGELARRLDAEVLVRRDLEVPGELRRTMRARVER